MGGLNLFYFEHRFRERPVPQLPLNSDEMTTPAHRLQDALESMFQQYNDAIQALNLFHYLEQMAQNYRDKIDRADIDDFDLQRDLNASCAEIYSWKTIAAKQYAINVFEVQDIMRQIRVNLIHEAPELKSSVDLKQLRDAQKFYDSKFPKIKKLRNPAAHPGLDAFEQSSFRMKMSGLDNKNETLFYGIDGEMSTIEINKNSINTLFTVIQMFFLGFKGAALFWPAQN